MYEYHLARVGVREPIAEIGQRILDDMARQGWRLVQTVESMGYTVGLIFERAIGRPMDSAVDNPVSDGDGAGA